MSNSFYGKFVVGTKPQQQTAYTYIRLENNSSTSGFSLSILNAQGKTLINSSDINIGAYQSTNIPVLLSDITVGTDTSPLPYARLNLYGTVAPACKCIMYNKYNGILSSIIPQSSDGNYAYLETYILSDNTIRLWIDDNCLNTFNTLYLDVDTQLPDTIDSYKFIIGADPTLDLSLQFKSENFNNVHINSMDKNTYSGIISLRDMVGLNVENNQVSYYVIDKSYITKLVGIVIDINYADLTNPDEFTIITKPANISSGIIKWTVGNTQQKSSYTNNKLTYIGTLSLNDKYIQNCNCLYIKRN